MSVIASLILCALIVWGLTIDEVEKEQKGICSCCGQTKERK